MSERSQDGPTDAALAQRLLAANPDGLWVLDDAGVTTYANENMARILGRDVDAMIGMPIYDVLDEQGRRDFRNNLPEMIASGAPQDNLDARFERPDGTKVWGLVSFVPLHDDDGNRTGWLHRVTPYTERKALLDALATREHQLATAQRIAKIGSWEWDLVEQTVSWSDEMYRIVGVEPGAPVTPATYRELIHPDDREGVEGSTIGEDDAFSFDHRLTTREGTIRWVRGRGVTERGPDGAVLRVSGTAQDITDLVTSDAHAEETARRLYMLQQMASAANLATSLREALLIAGAGVPMHTSWTPLGAQLYGAEPEFLDLGNGEHAVGFDPTLAERAHSTRQIGVGVPGPELAMTHSRVAVPVLVDDEVVAVFELLADEVPPDENSFQLLSQIAHQLGVVAQRERSAAQLAEARDDAMEASRLKSEFLATMSHEIRTPMNGVIGLTDLLMRTHLDDHQRRLTQNLQGAGLTLLGLINDILDLSKIEAGKLELETVTFDVRSVFEQAAAVFAGPAHDKGLELVVACHPEVPERLRGDPGRFGQIITNLGANAVKFTDTGEVVVQGSIESATPTEVVLRVDVSDTGVGIEPGERGRLFDAFTQADPSTTRRHGGTGLGLAISKQLAEALGGQISMTSEPGRGSTFSFTARFDTVSETDVRPPEPALDLVGRRVLVVDDNETNRFILEEQLSAWQTQPVSVASADAALVALHEAARSGRPFDAALLDQVMPGTDGLGLARQVHEDPALTGLAMVLLSSEHSLTRQQVDEAGIRAWLSKPVRHSELRNALLAVVGAASAVPVPEAPGRPRLTARVLVVEDNPVNQLVATGLLVNMGCIVDVAADGVEGVERLTGPHEYAAVLMDCRMPRMDGYDATREVRRLEAGGRRVPIIAMTASALEGERERCLAVGMDDFLTKPVDAAALERVIRTWVQLADPEVPDAPAGPQPLVTPAAEDAGVLDADRIAMLDGLVKDGISFFERTSTAFAARVGDQLRLIGESVDAADHEALEAASHQLKGAALNLGLPRVGEIAGTLEEIGVAGTTDGAAALLPALSDEVDRAVAALHRARTRTP